MDRFLCSFYDAPGKWGHRLSKILGQAVMKNRRLDGIDLNRVVENPWPELAAKVHVRLSRRSANAWITSAERFDRWAARRIGAGSSTAVICTENCAFATFQAAAKLGLRRIYDCPGHNAELWRETTEEAARRTGLPSVSVADTEDITRRKEVELNLADLVLTYSDFHSAGVEARGVARERIVQVPLWTDPEFWMPPAVERVRSGPLKVLFAGGINLRKGVPFLIEAVRSLAPHAHLTMVGLLDPDAVPCLAGTESFISLHAPVSKERLRTLYQEHDVLVLPSLGDSFGFVAMEAMACGLPVILTTHCGAPVPDPHWRVPIMDAPAIAAALTGYLDASDALREAHHHARHFAATYTPERYRNALITGIFSK